MNPSHYHHNQCLLFHLDLRVLSSIFDINLQQLFHDLIFLIFSFLQQLFWRLSFFQTPPFISFIDQAFSSLMFLYLLRMQVIAQQAFQFPYQLGDQQELKWRHLIKVLLTLWQPWLQKLIMLEISQFLAFEDRQQIAKVSVVQHQLHLCPVFFNLDQFHRKSSKHFRQQLPLKKMQTWHQRMLLQYRLNRSFLQEFLQS